MMGSNASDNSLEEVDNRLSYFQLLGELASGIFHEIRSPLQFIDNNLTFIEEGISSLLDHQATEEQQEFLRQELPEVIKQSREGMDRIHQMISALRKLSFQDNYDVQWFSLRSAWQEASLICAKEWKYRCRVDEGEILADIQIRGSHPLMVQVFINLIVNAAQAFRDENPSENLVSLEYHISGQELSLTVIDNGSGMEREIIEKIFDPFFTTKQMGLGSGQGLPFVKKMMEGVFQGSIQCLSTPGVGSRFILHFPQCRQVSS